MAITTGSFGRALWPGINAWWGKAYEEYQPEYTEIFKHHTSKKSREEDKSISSFGLALQTGEGQGVSYDTEEEGFLDTYQHAKFTLGFIITKEMYEDDQYDIVGERKAKGLAFAARQTRDTVGANVLNRAFNSSYTYGDGASLIATGRSNIAGGTWANEVSVNSDLSEASLEQACIDIAHFTDDRGKKIKVLPKKVIVPVELDFELGKIMKTEFEVGTTTNTVNLVRGRFPEGYHVNHYLTNVEAWFIITDVPDGLKYFERRPDTFTMDDDFDTDNAKYKYTARYSFGASDKRCIYGSPGA